MLKEFFRDSAVYGAAKILTGAVTLLALPVYTHALPPGEYGVVDLLTAVAAVAHVTVALEIAQGLGRLISAPDAKAAKEQYASTALWFTMASYTVAVTLAILFAAPASTWLFGVSDHRTVIRLAALVTWSTGIFFLLQTVMRYERRPLAFASVSIAFSLISVGVTVFLLLILRVGIIAVFIGQLAAGLFAIVIYFWLLRRTLSLRFDTAACREMLRFSIPLVPSSAGVMLCLYVDRYAVIKLMSIGDLGIYAVAVRLASVVPVAVSGFQFALIPLVFQHHQAPETPRQLARIFQWFLAVALPLVLFMGLFSRELLRIAAPSAYFQATQLIFLLSLSLLIATFYNFSPGLWIAKKTWWVAIITLSSGVLNLGLDFLLIPHVGLVGTAIATLASATLAAIAHFTFGQTFYRIPFQWRRIGLGACTAVATGALGAANVFGSLGLSMGPTLAIKGLTLIVASAATSWLLLGSDELRTFVDAVGARMRLLRAAQLGPEVQDGS